MGDYERDRRPRRPFRRGRLRFRFVVAAAPATGTVGSSQADDVWYDEAGNALRREPDGVMDYVEHEHDAFGRVVSETDPRSAVTAFAYDAEGSRTALTDAEGNATTWAYDGIGRVVSETNPLGDARRFEYDGAGNLAMRTDRLGRAVAFDYDAAGRTTAETWLGPDGTSVVNAISAAYDADGRAVAVSDDFAAYAYGYDGRGRLATVDTLGTPGMPRVVLTAEYDRLGGRTALAATVDGEPDFTNAWLSDGLGRTSRVTQTGTGVAAKRVDFSYLPLGGFAAIDRFAAAAGTAPVASSAHAYDGYGRLVGVTHAQGTTALPAYSRTFDSKRRVGTATMPDGTSDYGYDDAGQLTSAANSYQSDESYAYDGTGNRTTAGYDTGANNRLLSDGTHDYEYDAEGNRTLRTKTATSEETAYAWDHRNRLVGVMFRDGLGATTKAIAYVYDPHDRRIAKFLDSDGDGSFEGVERFAFDQGVKGGLDDCLLVFDGTGAVVERHLHGPAVDQPLAQEDGSGDVLWPLADPLGSVRDLAERDPGTGVTAVVSYVTYDSFGRIVSQTDPFRPGRYGFTGRERDDDAGLWWYRARWYDPGIGKFLCEDPLGFGGQRHQYVSVCRKCFDIT